MVGGGIAQIALWQARPFLDLLALLFLFQATYRGPADNALVGRAIMAAAVVKALLAIWVRVNVSPYFTKMEYTTTHGDSMLFVAACGILIAQLIERRSRKALLDAIILLPLLGWGIYANARRLAWVELAFVGLLFFGVTRWLPWKRRLLRTAIAGLPVLALYVAVGWESTTPFFGPVATLRSVIDTKHDRSTWDRHVESWNIATSIRDRPFRGRGFGHEYTEYMPMDDISSVFPMYKAEPHNFLLGLLLFAGGVAFAGIVAIFGATIFLAARTYRFASAATDRAGALVYMAIPLVVWLQTYGDMGILSPQGPLLAALAMALAGKAAVATGAYPSGAAPSGPVPTPSVAVPDRRRLTGP
jgi:O-antigen ligase